MKPATVPPENRHLVVLAYAHSIMEDVLTDGALSGDLPTRINAANDWGNRFEETFLQGNAPQWSVGLTMDPEADRVKAEAVAIVNRWLRKVAR